MTLHLWMQGNSEDIIKYLSDEVQRLANYVTVITVYSRRSCNFESCKFSFHKV